MFRSPNGSVGYMFTNTSPKNGRGSLLTTRLPRDMGLSSVRNGQGLTPCDDKHHATKCSNCSQYRRSMLSVDLAFQQHCSASFIFTDFSPRTGRASFAGAPREMGLWFVGNGQRLGPCRVKLYATKLYIHPSIIKWAWFPADHCAPTPQLVFNQPLRSREQLDQPRVDLPWAMQLTTAFFKYERQTSN